jgi:hypothetical protein
MRRAELPIHPMGDLIFDRRHCRACRLARLYIGCGDGGSGEQQNNSVRLNPQRLDTMVGKILRIIPDLQEHAATSTVSVTDAINSNDNPFTATAGARRNLGVVSGIRTD